MSIVKLATLKLTSKMMLNTMKKTYVNHDKFIAVPSNFVYMLDGDCLKLFTIFVQKESYWSAKGKLIDGCWFTKSIREIANEVRLSNTKDVGCAIQALVDNGIIKVKAYDSKAMTAMFMICWQKVNELNSMPLYDVVEFKIGMISKLPRNAKITYNKATACDTITDCNTNCNSEQAISVTNCTPTIYSINDNIAIAKAKAETIDVEDTEIEAITKVDSSTSDENSMFSMFNQPPIVEAVKEDVQDEEEAEDEDFCRMFDDEDEEDVEEEMTSNVQDDDDDVVEIDFARPTVQQQETAIESEATKEVEVAIDKLKVRWTVFLGLNKKLGWIVQPIRTQTKCGNQMLISLQNELNDIIKRLGEQPASAKACETLWHQLVQKVFDFDECFTATSNVEQTKYNEIIDAIFKIGTDIAFVCKRKHLGKDAANRYFYACKQQLLNNSKPPSPETLKSFLTFMTVVETSANPMCEVRFRNESEQELLEVMQRRVLPNLQKSA